MNSIISCSKGKKIQVFEHIQHCIEADTAIAATPPYPIHFNFSPMEHDASCQKGMPAKRLGVACVRHNVCIWSCRCGAIHSIVLLFINASL